MRKTQQIVVFTLLLLTSSVLIGIQPIHAQTEPSFAIGASIGTLASIVQEIGGPLVETSVFMPEGIEPHAFQLTQQIIDAANSADLLVLTGHFQWETDLVSITGKPYVAIEDYENYGAQLLQIDGEDNPHGYWLLPQNGIAIASAVREALGALNSSHSQFWGDRLVEFTNRVNDFSGFITDLDSTVHFAQKRVIITFPVEAYIAATFGMDVRSLLLKGENLFISGAELLEVETALRNGSIDLILASDIARLQAAGEFAEQLSTDTGVPIGWVKVLFFSGLNDYLSMLSFNTGVLTTVLLQGVPLLSDLIAVTLPIIMIAGILGTVAIIEAIIIISRARSRN